MVRTIFLATDGRHVTLGRGADHELPDEIARQVRSLGLRGFVATLAGDYHGGRTVDLFRSSAVDACPSEWDAAVSRFHGIRAGC